jgi:ABC-2 type transport system ATP-binding protein
MDLEVKGGEIFGFLGSNGAGKTTSLNMMMGLIRPTSGSIEIFGKKFISGDIEPLGRMGYVPETTSLPDFFTIHDLLDFYAQLFLIPSAIKNERINGLCELMGLSKEKHTLIKNLSMGQRRLVDIMQALINDPKLILLDEPTVYLDPLIIERLRSILFYLKGFGKTIIMSSHMLSEIGKLSDRLAVIHQGKILKICSMEDFLKQGSIEEAFLKLVKNETIS